MNEVPEQKEPWILAIDDTLMDRTGVAVTFDLDNNAVYESDLMSPKRVKIQEETIVYYILKRGQISTLEPYDVYPNNANVPIVSNRLKNAIEMLCPHDVAFLKALITAKNNEYLDCWCLIPLIRRECVDTENSEVARWWSTGPKAAMTFDRAVLHSGCMQGNHIVRDNVYRTTLFVSDELKKVIDAVNAYGLLFLRAVDLGDV